MLTFVAALKVTSLPKLFVALAKVMLLPVRAVVVFTHPAAQIEVVERNRSDDTFGFGIVLSDETLGNLRHADAESHAEQRREEGKHAQLRGQVATQQAAYALAQAGLVAVLDQQIGRGLRQKLLQALRALPHG